MLLILSTGLALNVAKTINRESSTQCTDQAGDAPCEQYLSWDLGLVSLEKMLIQPNDMLGNLLSSRGVEYFKIDKLINAAKSIFPFHTIRAGKELTFVTDMADSTVQAIVYEPDPYRRILFHLEDSIRVEIIEKETELKVETASGTIDQSLWVSMEEQNLPLELIAAMEDALGWSVDFYHIQKGASY